VAGTAPKDYRDPALFVSRTSFTKALREHLRLVLRRLAGETSDSAPVTTLITQFGGGKTHTLTLLYHLARHGAKVASDPAVASLLGEAGIAEPPKTRIAVFVGSAWDPQPGRETPWIDVARQLAGERGVELLGKDRLTAPPGTTAIAEIIAAAGGSALFLFDEVLNCLNRHRALADPFHSFIQNLTVAVTGSPRSAAVVSLPRSEVEMTDWDRAWQEKITKVVRRVAKDLIANDESQISDVIRKRLFEDVGKPAVRRGVAEAYAEWCYQRRAELPPEWTAVDTTATEAHARDLLRQRFEACYPFHPATLTVFQRKWQTLPQFQQTRGTLAMLAQWVSLAMREGYQLARKEAVITLGSAPLGDRGLRSAVLGQLGDSRLGAAIAADISTSNSHAAALDADATGALRDIHRRVGTAVLFESSGGQGDKAAHLPELRFALGEPGMDSTSIDNGLVALERKAYYLRKVGADGYRFGSKPKLNQVKSNRLASLDEGEVKRAMAALVEKEFEVNQRLPVIFLKADGSEVPETTRLTAIVLPPTEELDEKGALRLRVSEWTRTKGTSPRLYPGALLWVVRKPGAALRDSVADWLAWRRVQRELQEGRLGHDFDKEERSSIGADVRDAEDKAREEVWASYRYVLLADRDQPDGVGVLDLHAGHAADTGSLAGRIINALKTETLLNDSIGASYLDRKWPPALAESGAWPLVSLRQAFLNCGLDRVPDADAVLRAKIPEFVKKGEFGLASGARPDGSYSRVWFGDKDELDPDEIVFESDIYLLKKARAKRLRGVPAAGTTSGELPRPAGSPGGVEPEEIPPETMRATGQARPGGDVVIELRGTIPPDIWNRLGTRLVPKLRSGQHLHIEVRAEVTANAGEVEPLVAEIRQVLTDLQLSGQVDVRVR